MGKQVVFTGCGVAIVTPMHPDGAVNYEEFGKLIDFQIANGTDAIIVCGTTGECATLTEEEHNDVVTYCVKKTAGRVPVVAGAGTNNTATSVWLATHAAEVGADALLLVTPYYNKSSQAGLIEHYYHIADATDLPIILYNVPSRTACNIAPATYKELSKHPNIVATKEASGDFSAIAKIAAECGDDLRLYSGNDDHTVPIMALGGLGVISVLANICPREMHELAALLLQENYTQGRVLNEKYLSLMNAMFTDVNPVPVKEALNLMGYTCGRCRMPLGTLSEKMHADLAAILKKYHLIAE